MAEQTYEQGVKRYLERGAVEVSGHTEFDFVLEEAITLVERGLDDRFVITTPPWDEYGQDSMVVTTRDERPIFRYQHELGSYTSSGHMYDTMWAKHLVVRRATEVDEQLFGVPEGMVCIDASAAVEDHDFSQMTVPANQRVDIRYRYAMYPAVKKYFEGEYLYDHRWLQDILGQIDLKERYRNFGRIFYAAQQELMELQQADQRDFYHEGEVAALAQTVLSGQEGMQLWLRATETYNRTHFEEDGSKRKNDEMGWQYTPPEPSDVVGMRTYSWFKRGSDIGYDGDYAQVWFVAYRAANMALDMPLHAVTEVVEQDGDNGAHLLEGPTDVNPSSYHEYIAA